MRDNPIEFIRKAKPVDLAALLRQSDFVIRNNKDFDAVQELGALKDSGLDIGKIYPAKSKRDKAQVKDVARAEIVSASWSKEDGVVLIVNLFAKTLPNPTERNVRIVLRPPSAEWTLDERVSVPEPSDFKAVFTNKSFTCLVIKVAQKTDALFNKFLENQRQQAANQTTTQDSQANLLNNTTLPDIPS